ncbi:MAG: heavy metal translocating P-type ATPase, partial [Alphaproteobacteria bacterium]|nr:heavy metal translocating P-type ATPase [Alphaproteobacteria bacterium]
MNQHTNSAALSIDIDGMTCASCVARVEKALLKVPGVQSAAVNFATERATVVSDSGDAAPLLAAIEKAGYTGHPTPKTHHHDSGGHSHHMEDAAALQRDVILAAIPTVPLAVLEMGGHLYMPFHMGLISIVPQNALNIIYFVLTSFVLFVPGRRFFKTGIPALLRGAPEMNALVALGSGAAYLYSVVATFAPQVLPSNAQYVYYESAAVIVTLILVGRWLEAIAKGRTGDAIERLVQEQAKTARVDRDGTITEVAISAVQAGDIIVVRPGEKIAVDGEIVEGSSHIDESMISGESLPVSRAVGATVIG